MPPNVLTYAPVEMNQFVQKYEQIGDAIDWVEIMNLNQHGRAPIVSITVFDGRVEVAYVQWGWGNEWRELQLHKIEVKDSAVQGKGWGTTLMKMVIAIARFYEASEITGTITGEDYLWDWYRKLGFTIHDQRKLLMELPQE